MYGLKQDWELGGKQRCLVLDDYVGATPRWCPGCGDHGVLGALQRLARDEQIPPEKMVVDRDTSIVVPRSRPARLHREVAAVFGAFRMGSVILPPMTSWPG